MFRKGRPEVPLPLFPTLLEGAIFAGVDEAGRGALAGPVVAAAVILPAIALKERIDDSKKLSCNQREETYRALISAAEVGIGIVEVSVIDDINILQATLLAMQKAILQLKVMPDMVLIDGKFVPRVNLPCSPVVDGDALIPCISAASIIAKVTRDRIMVELDRLYPVYGFARHKGYGTSRHLSALQSYGPTETHRKSFSPVKITYEQNKTN